MGRIGVTRVSDIRESGRSMYFALYCCLLYLSLSSRSVLAADIDIYPGFDDDAVIRRIQNLLREMREREYQLVQPNREPILPQFTFHFPEDTSRRFQSDLFAVPPSDPRYYQPAFPEADNLVDEDKRKGNGGSPSETMMSNNENNQVGTPKTSAEESTQYDEVTSVANGPEVKQPDDVTYVFKKLLTEDNQGFVLVALIAAGAAAAAAGVVTLFYGWYRLRNNSKAAADIEYPAYGVTGPNKEITPTGDRRLAQSAQMYHYQHQKQQIIAMESNRVNNERRGSVSEGDSDEENEEGDYTVYECPGLAATGELEVKNPLFQDDPTPAALNHNTEQPSIPAADNK